MWSGFDEREMMAWHEEREIEVEGKTEQVI